MQRYIELEAESCDCLSPHTKDSGSEAGMTRAGCRPGQYKTPVMLSLPRSFILFIYFNGLIMVSSFISLSIKIYKPYTHASLLSRPGHDDSARFQPSSTIVRIVFRYIDLPLSHLIRCVSDYSYTMFCFGVPGFHGCCIAPEIRQMDMPSLNLSFSGMGTISSFI